MCKAFSIWGSILVSCEVSINTLTIEKFILSSGVLVSKAWPTANMGLFGPHKCGSHQHAWLQIEKKKSKRLNRVGKFRKVECCKIKKHEEQMGGGNVAKLDDSWSTQLPAADQPNHNLTPLTNELSYLAMSLNRHNAFVFTPSILMSPVLILSYPTCLMATCERFWSNVRAPNNTHIFPRLSTFKVSRSNLLRKHKSRTNFFQMSAPLLSIWQRFYVTSMSRPQYVLRKIIQTISSN